MTRITNGILERLVELLNRETGNPETPWMREDGRNVANIGNYHLSGAYGGVCLHQMANDGGGAHDVFSCGHVTKRELYNRIHSFRAGFRAKQEA